MIEASNLWEADRLRKLRTAAQVEQEQARCVAGAHAAHTAAKRREWERKSGFLFRLRAQLLGAAQ